MELIVDLHTHSHFSRATSKECTLEGLYKWAKIKGINVVGTGDFTHPGWFTEISDKLEPAEPGLFKLKEGYAKAIDQSLPASVRSNLLRFILTVEISNIYSKNNKVRKLHNLVITSSLEIAAVLNEKLGQIGNLKADGRPILGLDSKRLLQICLETDLSILYIPAHIWTPWFAMFGSKSGFNSIEEAFEELTCEIKAIETGLSSDPYMNWRLEQLKNITIVSNSDAHSPSKLGREANVVDAKLDYFDIVEGVKLNDNRVVGTIEFFPQEGMYHFDGHRKCRVCFSPEETKKHQGICPVCHKLLTVGVDFRVEELSNHPPNYKPKQHKSVEYIIPLVEIIAEIKGVGVSSKSVKDTYEKVYSSLGHEFNILRHLPTETIAQEGYSELAFAIEKMRKGEIYIEPGYDGVYGTIKLFESDEEIKNISGQLSLL